MLQVIDVAKYIIDKCVKDGSPISNLQLQKILYYVQVDFLKRNGEPLFSENIEAWQFGPVVPEAYNRFCGFGSLPIENEYEVSLHENLSNPNIICLNQIIEEKREKYPWDLVAETHTKDKAWSKVYKDGIGNRDIISKELLLQHG